MSDVPVYRPHDVSAGARASAILQRASQNVAVEIVGASTSCGYPCGVDRPAAPRRRAQRVHGSGADRASRMTPSPKADYRALLAWKNTDGREQLAGIWTFAIGRPRRSVLPMPVMRVPGLRARLSRDAGDRPRPSRRDARRDARLHRGEQRAAEDHVARHHGHGRPDLRSAASAFWPRAAAAPACSSRCSGRSSHPMPTARPISKTRCPARAGKSCASTGGSFRKRAPSPPRSRPSRKQSARRSRNSWRWKRRAGRAGRARRCPATKPMRRSCAARSVALAEHGCAIVHSIHLDGRPVSMQIVARAGAAAFTWKTAYDEAFHDFSPGMLLLEDYTAAFLADKSIAFVDSCSFDDTGFMSAWQERQSVADIWIDARRGGSLEFRALSGLQKPIATCAPPRRPRTSTGANRGKRDSACRCGTPMLSSQAAGSPARWRPRCSAATASTPCWSIRTRSIRRTSAARSSTVQIATLRLTGLADAVLRASTPDRECWVARFGRLVEKRPGDQQRHPLRHAGQHRPRRDSGQRRIHPRQGHGDRDRSRAADGHAVDRRGDLRAARRAGERPQHRPARRSSASSARSSAPATRSRSASTSSRRTARRFRSRR